MPKNTPSKSARQPRRPQPFFRSQTQSWYVQIDGRQINLGRDRDAAWEKYDDVMASHRRDVNPGMTVAELLDDYLEYVHQNRAQRTYLWYRNYLRKFVAYIGKRLKVTELRPYHITRWLTANFAELSSASRNCAVRAVRTPFNWAVTEGLLDRNPIKGVKRPAAGRREMVLTTDEFDKLVLANVSDQQERDLMVFLWETGARVQELRRIEACHFQPDARRVVLPPSLDKSGHYRVIYLTATAQEIAERLASENPEGALFRNRRGKPWTSNAIRCRFRKCGVTGLCGTVLRHSFCQRMLTSGVDSLTVSVLMGHRDLTMVASTYSHLARDANFLRGKLDSATSDVIAVGDHLAPPPSPNAANNHRPAAG